MTAAAAMRGRTVDPLSARTRQRLLADVARRALAGDLDATAFILRLGREQETPATELQKQHA